MPDIDTSVAITFVNDEIPDEDDESFMLRLEPKPFTLQTIPRGEGVFFKNVLHLTILDSEIGCKLLTYY